MIFYTAITLGILVFVHELGHFLAAKFTGMRVDRFSIGFPPRAFGKKIGDTDYCISWLPLGGYVQFAGDRDAASRPDPEWDALPSAERDHMFQSKSLWQRALIVFAGPAINFLFAILILAGFAFAYGKSVTPPVVAGVMASSNCSGVIFQPVDSFVSTNTGTPPARRTISG